MKTASHVACLGLVILLGLILLGSPSNDIFGFNEVIWIDFFVRDLFSGYHFKWWNVAWNPYFFPDALVYLALLPISDFGLRLGGYALVLALGLAGFTAGIARRLWGLAGWTALALGLAAVTTFCVLFFNTAILGYSLIPVFHGGSAVLGLCALYLSLGVLAGNRPITSLLLMFAVIATGVFSDGVLLYSYIAPLCLTAVLMLALRAGPTRPLVRILLSACAAAALGYTLRDAANRFGWLAIDQKVPVTLEFFAGRLGGFLGEHFGQFLKGGLTPAGLLLLVLAASAPLAALAVMARRGATPAQPPRPGRMFAAVFAFLAPVFAALFYVACIDREIMLFRALSLVVVPFFVGAAFLAGIGGPSGRAQLTLAIVICVAAVVVRHGALRFGPRDFHKNHAAFAGEFDAVAGPNCLRRGLAKPELAKHLTAFAKTPVFINQITDALTPHHYVDNLEWYAFEPDGACRGYDFIIDTPDAAGRLIKAFGEPRLRLPYRGYEIFVYDRDSDLSFRNVFKARVLAGLGRLDLISLPKARELRGDVPDGTACRFNTCVYVPAGSGLRIEMDKPSAHNLLEIALAADTACQVRLEDENGRPAGEFSVPKAGNEPEVRRHYFRIPEAARAGKITAVRVAVSGNEGKYAVARAAMYDDCPVNRAGEAACEAHSK